jgi:hypothetical protein
VLRILLSRSRRLVSRSEVERIVIDVISYSMLHLRTTKLNYIVKTLSLE